MMVSMLMWGVVRRSDDGNEFVLPDEMSGSHHVATMREECNAKAIPSWHNANPVSRVAQFRVQEV